MFQYWIRFSLNNSTLLLLGSLLFLGFTFSILTEIPVDIFPELNAPTVVILTEAGGFVASEVEQYITFPIESALNGITGLRRVRSASSLGLSIVWAEFDWTEDLFRARQSVSERLSTVIPLLPEEAHAEIAPTSSVAGEVMLISLALEKNSSSNNLEMRAFAEFELRNRLLAIPGVAQVVAIGGELPEYQVLLQQEALRSYNLRLDEIVEAVRRSNSTDSAGYLYNVGGEELSIRQLAQVRSVEDIRQTLIRQEQGQSIRIGDVATVQLAGAPKRGEASENGSSAVVLSIQKTPSANTLKLTKEIDRVLHSVQQNLPKGIQLNPHLIRQSDFIERGIHNVFKVLRDAAIFVALILILFLLNWRTTFITLTALPLSLAVALIMLWKFGMSLNTMTLGGFAVAIGELVDDAIIDVENVHRRLHENQLLPLAEQKKAEDVIYHASDEIRSSVIFATVIIVLVFLPLLFLKGVEGHFFRPLGIAYIISILASLVVALTVTPALCRWLLTKTSTKAHNESGFSRWLKSLYEPTLRRVSRFQKTILALSIVSTILVLLLASTFGSSFLPEFNEGTFTILLFTPPGTSLYESSRIAKAVEEQIQEIKGVRHVARRTGRAERDLHAEPVSNSEIEVALDPGVSKSEIRHQISKILENLPGMSSTIGQPIEHRISHILSGTPAAIAINVYGDSLEKLREIAKEMDQKLKSIPGLRDIVANREVMTPSLVIRYRSADLNRWGLTSEEVAHQVKIALNGETIDEIFEGIRRYSLVVRLQPQEREQISQVQHLLIQTRKGQWLRLKEIADIGKEQTSNLITRENARRKAIISCNIEEGYNLGHLIEIVRKEMDPIVSRYGYSIEYGGQFEAQQSAKNTIVKVSVLVFFMILILLSKAFHSVKCAFLVLLNLPLALIGGVLGIYLFESQNLWQNTLALFSGDSHYQAPVLSIASLVGFITLFGIAVRNGILLVKHYQYLEETEGKSVEEAVFQGSLERMNPILMTALTAILGLVPLVLEYGEPGSELLAPLALVVLSGLISSTFLNLFVVPVGYLLLFKNSSEREVSHAS
jgi:Cu(I)/Ag(I) efflux system membrane protein CusA/SilA